MSFVYYIVAEKLIIVSLVTHTFFHLNDKFGPYSLVNNTLTFLQELVIACESQCIFIFYFRINFGLLIKSMTFH